MKERKKVIRITTVPTSLATFCKDMLRELSERYEVVAVSSPLPELDKVRIEEGVRVEAVEMKRQIAPFSDLKSLWKMYRLMRRERPWLVHSMTPKAGLLSMLAAWMARVPNRVHTFTGLIWPTSTGIKRCILILMDKLLCACATKIIPEGNGVKRDLETYGITRKPMKVLAYGNVRGIDLDYYCRNEYVINQANNLRENEVFTFIFIGRLVKDKGVNELVNAFVRFNEQYPKSKLLLVGRMEDELDPLLPKTISEINNNPAINAVGPQDDVRVWLAASDVFVFPSYREGFPNVVIEAGAMGLPSIVTDINGSNEIIVDGENGVIISSKNEQKLYEAMVNMYQDKEMRMEMSSKARPMVASRFDCHVVRQALYDFYKSL